MLRLRQICHHFGDDILKCLFLNENVWILIRFHWCLFQFTVFQHWFRWWLGADHATSHYLNKWWLVYQSIYASLDLIVLTLQQSLQCPRAIETSLKNGLSTPTTLKWKYHQNKVGMTQTCLYFTWPSYHKSTIWVPGVTRCHQWSTRWHL